MSTREKKAPFATNADLITTLVVGGIAAVWVIISLIVRLAEILPNDRVPVLISVAGIDLLPLGPGGAEVPADVSTVTALVSGMPGITLFSVAAAAVIPAIAALIVIGCSMVLFSRLLRGRFFSKGNTKLIATVSLTIVIAWAVGNLFETMASNGALAVVSDRQLESVQFGLDFVPVLASMGIGALCAAFHAGDRMQRDTEGLV